MAVDSWMPWLWLVLTLLSYLFSRWLYRRKRLYILSPLLLAPFILFLIAVPLQTSYAEYVKNTRWLILMLGPATVAFAIPIWKQRKLIAQHWLCLSIGMFIGSMVSVISSLWLARILVVDEQVTLSILPRTITTPFAMLVAENIGGVPELAAVFVVITGVLGAVLGSILITILPFRTTLARGAIFGIGAHAAGVARANEFGVGEASIAGVTMVLMGLINFFAAPLILCFYRFYI